MQTPRAIEMLLTTIHNLTVFKLEGCLDQVDQEQLTSAERALLEAYLDKPLLPTSEQVEALYRVQRIERATLSTPRKAQEACGKAASPPTLTLPRQAALARLKQGPATTQELAQVSGLRPRAIINWMRQEQQSASPRAQVHDCGMGHVYCLPGDERIEEALRQIHQRRSQQALARFSAPPVPSAPPATPKALQPSQATTALPESTTAPSEPPASSATPPSSLEAQAPVPAAESLPVPPVWLEAGREEASGLDVDDLEVLDVLSVTEVHTTAQVSARCSLGYQGSLAVLKSLEEQGEVKRHGTGWLKVLSAVNARKPVLAALERGQGKALPFGQVVAWSGLPAADVETQLQNLQEEGVVRSVPGGRWCLTEQGAQRLEGLKEMIGSKAPQTKAIG